MSANFNIVDLLKRKQPRQPWDERLPSGELPFDPFRGGGQPEAPAPRQTPSPALQRTSLGVPNGDVVEMLKRPAEPPNPFESMTAAPAVSPNIGTSTAGMNPMAKQQALVDLMRSTPAGQKVRQQGDQVDVTPPEQSPSRVKNALVGLLLGTAQGGLAGGIGGAALGAIKPQAIQELLKAKHLAREEGQLDSQIEREGKQAGIDYTKARTEELRRPPEAKVYAPELRTDADGNLISVQGTTASPVLDKQGKPVKGRVSADGETVAVTVDGKTLNVTPAQALTYFGQIGRQSSETAEKNQTRQAKRDAAQAEYDLLVKDEAEAGKQKNEAYAYLEKIKAAAVNGPSGDIDAQSRMDIEQATRAAQEADKVYQSFAEKKRDAQTRIKENTVSTAQPYAGRTMSGANLAKYAKDKGISEDEARKQVEAQGVRVQ